MNTRVQRWPNRAEQGFTMIEIMIVVGILSLLVALTIPSMVRARTNSKIKKARAELEMLSSAIMKLAWDTGMWPAKLDRTVVSSTETWDLNVAAAGLTRTDGGFPHWEGPYHRKIPKDPWGQNYFFDPDYYVGADIRVVVGSFGPNKKGPNVYDKDDVIVFVDGK